MSILMGLTLGMDIDVIIDLDQNKLINIDGKSQ